MVVTANANGTFSITNPTGNGPYDGSDDTLVGFVNNTAAPISSIFLSSTTADIFGFDGDGIDTYGAPGNAIDGTGYGGPNSYFDVTLYNPGVDETGFVDFITPIGAGGGSTYFSLEEDLTNVGGGGLMAGGGATPEPSSLVLLGTGILGLAGAARRRFIK